MISRRNIICPAAITAISLTTSYAGASFGDMPAFRMSAIFFRFITIAGGATGITWFLSGDPDGDEAATPEVFSPIVTGVTTATSGGFSARLDIDFMNIGSVQNYPNTVWIWAKTNAGTCVMDSWIVGER